MRALKVGPGDAVFCPSFTFAATAEVVVWFGATPVFVDIHEDTFNMDARSLEAAIDTAKSIGLRPAGVISVDLFGLPADYDSIEPVCKAHRLWLIDDAAQAFGATYKGRKLGTVGIGTGTSFSLKKKRNGVVPAAPPSNARHLPFVQSVPPCAGWASNSAKLAKTSLPPGATAMKVVTHFAPTITGS
jgi:hypothetical protein